MHEQIKTIGKGADPFDHDSARVLIKLGPVYLRAR